MRVKLSSLPTPKSGRTVTLSNFWGGLNLLREPEELSKNQSPDMENMWYRDGVLRRRDGVKAVFPASASNRDPGQVHFYDRLFHGYVVYADGRKIRYFDPANPGTLRTVEGDLLPENGGHGTFFPFDERLYYKARDVYLRLALTEGEITAERLLWKENGDYQISDSVYTPILAMNRNPDGSGGDLYQPENRINPKKEVWFDIDSTSHDYILPDSGCRVLSIRLGEDAVDASDSLSRSFSLGGRTVTVLDETGENNTKLRFDVPLYVDEENWTTQDHTSVPSTGDNYLPNVVYSTFDIPVGEDTEFRNPTVLKARDGAVPSQYTMTFLAQALDRCPYEDKNRYFVTENEDYMNLFVLGDGFALDNYDSATTEMWMRDYYRVTYRKSKDLWSAADFSGRSNLTGWHYARNVVLSHLGSNLTWEGTTVIANHISTGGICTHSFKSLAELALTQGLVSLGAIPDAETAYTKRLYWISRNEDYVVFHYLINDGTFRVTRYDGENGFFHGKGCYLVTIPRLGFGPTGSLSGWVSLATGQNGGFFVKNIVYARDPIVWNGYVPGEAIVTAGGEEAPEEYRRYAEIALYRARRDCPEADITGDYAVAAFGEYVTVYVDTGLGEDGVTWYDCKTGEFKAAGFIAQRYVKREVYEDITLDLTTPAVLSNKLKVVYTKDNPEALQAIADCRFASDFGGADAVCAVVAGSCMQPNAIFWSGNGSYGVDPTYFPMDQYNLCGAYQDPVTGFGRQQGFLAVFQGEHVSKAVYGLTELSGRKTINLTVTTVNAQRGCDLPWTIRLCGNNLVWLHSKYGAMYLRDATAAGENTVAVISEHVNGSAARPGLLHDLAGTDEFRACAGTDGRRYCAFAGEKLYVWDYSLTAVSDGTSAMSWTRHGDFHAVQSVMESGGGRVWMLDGDGKVTAFDETLATDLGAEIPCHYRTPTLTLGGGDRLWRVREVICALRNDGKPVTVTYGGQGRQMLRTGYEPRIPDTPESGEFRYPLVLRPRGLRVKDFYLELTGEGNLEICEITVTYEEDGRAK